MSAEITREPPRWPSVVLEAPVLRGLEPRALREIEAAGQLRRVRDGDRLYRGGEGGEAFFVVVQGAVELRAVRRGEAEPGAVRTARPGDSFGEEPLVGATRRTEAVAAGDALVAEIPVPLFRRAIGRSGRAEVAERLERTLRRGLVRDVLSASSLGRELSGDALDVVVDAATVRHVDRGAVLFDEGEPARELLVLGEGLLQLQSNDGERVRVRGYLSAGDLVGEGGLVRGGTREATAVAMGASLLVAVPDEVVHRLARADDELVPRLRRLSRATGEARAGVVQRAAANATMHVFRDLYRLEVARSLLVIDLETCVRCGHCAWACGSLYGASRLVRRGDVVVTDEDADLRPATRDREVGSTWISGEAPRDPAGADFDVFAPGFARGAPKKLLLPSSCQHCENPACLIDCPTGAIGKDPQGEVFIREPLCTGCGACVRACPWDNVRLDERAKDAPRPAGVAAELVAVKCDLCRGYENGPACVQACPVDAITRIRPLDEVAELRAIFGDHRRARRETAAASTGPSLRVPRPPAWSIAAGALVALVGLGAAGASLVARGAWVPRSGGGYAAGVLAAVLVLALALYTVPKRVVRLWTGKRVDREAARAAEASAGTMAGGEEPTRPRRGSFVRPHYTAHLVLGGLAAAIALGHAPLRGAGTIGGALLVGLLATCLVGGAGALAYAWLPRRLARLERRALLPEDFPGAGEALVDRLHRELSGTSDLVKAIAGRVLLPYAKHPLGPLMLVATGRRLRDEEARLLARVEGLLEGRGKDRLAGLGRLVRTCVEMRALPAQRGLTRLLRAVVPVHAVLGAIVLALLVLHVGAVLAR